MAEIKICDECLYFLSDKGWCRKHKREEEPLKSCDEWTERPDESYLGEESGEFGDVDDAEEGSSED